MRLPTRLLQRRKNSHKGDFGHIFILAGSLRFSGASLLSAEAALRSGAGLVTLGIPKSLALRMVRVKPKEVMLLPLAETKDCSLSLGALKRIKDFLKKADIIVIGPGISQDNSTKKLIRKIIPRLNKPAVIDADGLNALTGHLSLLRNKEVILTPHPGEMARLLEVGVKKVQSNRLVIAKEFARKHRLTLVLKGFKTIVADYSGRNYINRTGNPGMATAGSGDVLAGIIASFLAQGVSAFEAAKYAVYLHGLAGDLAAKEKTEISLIASDIIAKIPEAIKKSS